MEQEKKAAQQRLKAWEKQQKKNLERTQSAQERAQDEIAEKQRRLKIAKDLTGSELNVDAINKLLLSNYWMKWSLCPGLTFATWIHVYNILKDNNISNSVYNKINLMYAVIYFIPLFLAFLHNGTASGNFYIYLMVAVWIIGIVHMNITYYLVKRSEKKFWAEKNKQETIMSPEERYKILADKLKRKYGKWGGESIFNALIDEGCPEEAAIILAALSKQQ